MGFRDQSEAQRAKSEAQQAKIDALERRVAELEGTDTEANGPVSAADDGAPAKARSYERVPLLTRWLVVAVVLAGGPALRGCASEPMALPALRVACPTSDTLSTDVRSGGMVPGSRGGYSETLDISWTCDGASAGMLQSIAGSIGWGLLAAAAFLLLASAMVRLPKAAWPLPALLATLAGAGHAWWAWRIDEPAATWAGAGSSSLLTWGLLLMAGASVSACTDLAGPEGDDPSVGYMLGTTMLIVGVFGAVPVFNVFVAVAAFVFAAIHTKRPLLARVAMALVAPAMVAVPWAV